MTAYREPTDVPFEVIREAGGIRYRTERELPLRRLAMFKALGFAEALLADTLDGYMTRLATASAVGMAAFVVYSLVR